MLLTLSRGIPSVAHVLPCLLTVEESDDDTNVSYNITGISRKHRAVLTFFYLLRVMVCVILTVLRCLAKQLAW